MSVTCDSPFPFHVSEADLERIKMDSDGAVAETQLVVEVKERMSDSWPDKGFIENGRYDGCKAVLAEFKGQILEPLAETDDKRAEYEAILAFKIIFCALRKGHGMLLATENIFALL